MEKCESHPIFNILMSRFLQSSTFECKKNSMQKYEGQPVKILYNFFYTHLQFLWILDRDKNAEVFSYLSLFGLEYLYRCLY